MNEPVTELVLEAPGGLVRVRADCEGGKAKRITVQNLPSFAQHLGAVLEVEGLGTLIVDTAFGGDSFVIVDAPALGFAITPDEAGDLARLGVKITNAANEQLGFSHPTNADWTHISFCNFMTPVMNGETRSAVAIQPGKIDRSPCGIGVSARLAVLAAKGLMGMGDTISTRSIIDGQFTGRIARLVDLNGTPAIIPEISGRAWVTGTHQHMLDPDAPWLGGYRLTDTWGASGGTL